MMNHGSKKPLPGTVGRGRESRERNDDLKGLSLLLVEDDDLIRESLLDWLASVLPGLELAGDAEPCVAAVTHRRRRRKPFEAQIGFRVILTVTLKTVFRQQRPYGVLELLVEPIGPQGSWSEKRANCDQ